MNHGRWLWTLIALFGLWLSPDPRLIGAEPQSKVYILPIRENIMPPLVYLVRRGVKEAIAADADLLILDMDTDGGRVDVTEKIIEILNRFKGHKITYVNKKAFSAGTFISVATQEIYMAPGSVIGAAAPIMMTPGGGIGSMPPTMEAKITSGISALVRANAERNGHNVDVIEAMIDKSKELRIDGEVLCERDQILTLTNKQAERTFGDPPKPLLSAGTVENLDALLDRLGFSKAEIVRVEPTGAEQAGSWINEISALLLIVGIIGVYLEFKTPGFGLPGIIGITAFALYFLGGYIAGLSGLEWAALFALGLILLIVEVFIYPGTILAGLLGLGMMLTAIFMALVDLDPNLPVYSLPSTEQFVRPVEVLSIAFFGTAASLWVLSRWLPKTTLYHVLISNTASAMKTEETVREEHQTRLGQIGTTVSVLRPSGKAQFGDALLDVVTQGDWIDNGASVRIIGFSGREAMVESATDSSE